MKTSHSFVDVLLAMGWAVAMTAFCLTAAGVLLGLFGWALIALIRMATP